MFNARYGGIPLMMDGKVDDGHCFEVRKDEIQLAWLGPDFSHETGDRTKNDNGWILFGLASTTCEEYHDRSCTSYRSGI